MLYSAKTRVLTAVIVHMAVVPILADYNNRYNLIGNPYAEQGFTGWHHAASATMAMETASVGTKCWQLNPTDTQHSDIRSVTVPIDAQQRVQFGYSFKSQPGSVLPAAKGYAGFRCWDDTDNLVGESLFALEETAGVWRSFEHEVLIPAGTAKFDVRIIADAAAQGPFLVDDIYVYRELYPLALQVQPPDTLYVIRKSSLDNAAYLMMQSLQGIVAQVKSEIYFDQGDMTYLNDLVANHGMRYFRSDLISFYVNRYKSRLAGYILYDLADPQSILAASSLTGIMQALMVDVSLESSVQSYGLPRVIDVRGKDCRWVYQNYWDQFNKNGIMMKNPTTSGAYHLRDVGAAHKLMWWWDPDPVLTSEVLDKIIDNSHCWGWDDPSAPGELDATQFHSEYGLYTGAESVICNISVLSAVGLREPDATCQPPNANVSYSTENNVHYVCFMMSDMDNLGTELGANNWNLHPDYYGSPYRGQIAIGWGMPASLAELAPSVMQWWYRNATIKDGFSATCSGLGYMYASYFPDLDNHTRKTEQLMKRSGLRTCVISDRYWPRALTTENYYPIAHMYTRLEPVRGVFYFDVNGDYARYGREADQGRAQRIYWFDRKPFVPCRYVLWENGGIEGASKKNGLQLAAAVNALPANPGNPASYTFVMVHAWSYGLNEVKTAINNFAPHVRVVTPDELIEQIYMNLSPCGDAPIKADLNDDCLVNLVDFGMLADDWLAVGGFPSDLYEDGKIDLEDVFSFTNSWLE